MFEQTFRSIDDVLWKEAGCTTELDYTEQTSWMLFLKYLDDLEHEKALAAELQGRRYRVKLFMDAIDQGQKTLVFCATQDHALAVRDLVNQMKTSQDPNYCV